jgi:ubiquinol-cytochrome c reductase cytochrome b subunit
MKILGRTLDWIDDRTGLIGVTRRIMQHPVPRGATWWYVFGSATLLAFIIQVITGIVLAAMYAPAPNVAYQSLHFITNEAFLGNFIRGLHSWSATAMVVLIGIHMIQVFLFAAYKFPREANWMTGVILLGLTVAMAFTGQILRWDDNGVWSTVVLIKMVGRVPLFGEPLARFILSGDVVSGATLNHFYTFHVFVIPALIFATIGIHLFLVIRNGISEPPQAGRPVDPRTYRTWYHAMLRREGVPFFPDAMWRDAVFAVGVLAVLIALAAIVGPPDLTNPPSPAILDTVPRPDWYFIWLFAALALLPPGLEFYILIGGSLLVFTALFVLPLVSNKGERSVKTRPWAAGAVLIVVTMIASTTVIGFIAPWSPRFNTEPLPPTLVAATTHEVALGGQLFFDKGCQYCHTIASGYGGLRGPDLTYIGDRLSKNELTWRIANGGVNMPAFAGTLTHDEMEALVEFLASRKRPGVQPETSTTQSSP